MKHQLIILLLLLCFFQTNSSNAHDSTVIIEEHKKTIDTLCHGNNPKQNNTAHRAFANELVEWAFSSPTSKLFLRMHDDQTQHQELQFLYTALWSILAEKGWGEWHETCLQNLKREHDAGKTIIYIGGGCDIYQLITHGMYNITIIDPILPSQEVYYPKDYLFLISGTGPEHGIGNIITGLAGDKKLTLKRTSFESLPTYTRFALPSGQQRCIPVSKTTWSVLGPQQTLLGTITFDRRVATQKDFEHSAQQVLLLSWNELYFVINGNWGIKTDRFRDDITLFIKQLRKPITKEVIHTMCQAHELNVRTFKFIGLGSHVI